MVIGQQLRHSGSTTAAMVLRSTSSCQRVHMHLGRASAAGTKEFLARGGGSDARSVARLRVGKCGSNGAESSSALHVSRRGVGSPYLWAKDVPRIDASKHAISSFQSNFLQASINPYVDTGKDAEKQAYIESLVLQELVDSFDIPRDGLVLSALLTDDIVRPATGDAAERLAANVLARGVRRAAQELDVELLDHVVVRVPDELITSKSLGDTLRRATDALETLRSDNLLQSYGFALAGVGSEQLDRLVETVLADLADDCDHFASLQLPISLSSNALLPLSPIVTQFQDAKQMLVVADRPLDAVLANGKPLRLAAYSDYTGDDVAKLLQSAFNLALSVERKYLDTLQPELAHLGSQLPAAEDVAWAHILAHQHGQFDNLQEWLFVRETQIAPRFEATLAALAACDETKDLGFAYSIALRELLKCFTASIELLDASRAQSILDVAVSHKFVDEATASLEEVAVRAALSSGADIVLVQEQLGGSNALAFDDAVYSREQLAQFVADTESLLQAT